MRGALIDWMPASVLALVACVLAGAAAAEGLDAVTVSATRTTRALDEIPAAVSTVGAADVQFARQQLGLDESLVRMPGVFMQNRYNFAQDLRISIRGFGARAGFGIRGIRIFVDGIPETLPDGQGQVDSIDLGSVGRITVLRTASAALYGSASGGVILIESEEPPEGHEVGARLSFGEGGFAKHQLEATGTLGDLGYAINLSDLDMDGFRAHSEAESRQVNAMAHYRFDASSSLRVAFNSTDQPRSNDPGALTRAEVDANPRQAAPNNLLYAAGEELDQKRLGIVYEKAIGETHEFSARNYYVWRDFANSLPFRAGGAVTIERFFVGGGLSYTNSASLFGRDNRLVVGLDVDLQDDDRKRFDNDFGVRGPLVFDQNERVTSTGIFVQDELRVRDDLQLTLGLRHDRIEIEADDRFGADGDDSGRRTLSRTSPMFGVLYDVAPRIHVYATASTSFETPTTTELANPDGGGGFNTALQPQLARSYEIGVKSALGARSRMALALFRIDLEDELVPFELPGFPGRDFFRNAGESRRNGVELAFEAAPTETLELAFAWTWSDFEFTRFVDAGGRDFGGNAIPGQPEHVLYGEIAWRDPSGLFAAWDTLYVADFPLDDANSQSSSSYTVSNFRVGYSAEIDAWRWSVFGGANNILDEEYAANARINAFGGRFFEPGPQRNLYGGAELTYRF